MVGHNSKYTHNLYKSFANEVEICLSMLLHYKIGKRNHIIHLFIHIFECLCEAIVVGYKSMSIDGFLGAPTYLYP